KFDWMENHFTPEGEALTAFTPGALGANGLPLAIAYAQSPGAGKLDGANRPDAVNNFFTTPGYQRVYGHNLTSTLQASDSLTIKNIFGYRRSFIVSVSDLTGAGSLVTTPAVAAQLETNSRLPAGSLSSLIGSPYVAGGSATLSKSKQFSDELQLNYDSELLTLTTGLMWFNVKTETGAPDGLLGPSTILSPVRGGVPGRNSRNLSFITMESFAGYAQAEFHVTPQLDIIGGYRLTHDIKNGVTWIRNTPYGFSYKDTRASYMGTVNYRPNNDILVYGKYATGYVSGGSVSGIDFKPEIATSWEAGAKADLFNRMLRLNLALFKTKYQDLQAVSGGTFLVPPRPELGTLIINDGDLKTKGFEVEATLVPVRGVTLSASGGYTKAEASNSNAALGLNRNLTLRPKWTSNVSAQYESDPLFGDTSFVIRADGAWRSKVRTVGQNGLSADYNSILYSPKGWVVNGRVGLQNVNLGGAKADITLWGRNIFDQDRPMFPIYFAFLGSTSYERARTYGVDVAFKL
ncbi:MAG TPA: TonB-dependent receptor, partial [Sphingobium sp.]|nr:TonB-dependent receptor [Sphingobium sp.]